MRDIVTGRGGTLSRPTAPRRAVLTTALAFATTLSMSMAIAPQAHAQSDCANRICLFEHDNYGGRHVTYATGSSDMSRFGPFFNDMTSSFRNNTGSRWCAYEHANYGGAHLTIGPGESRASLGAWNDRISSIRRC